MSLKAAVVRYSRNKDCFSVLSTDLFKLGFNEPFLVIKVVYGNEQNAYFSWSGEAITSSINVLQINGVYANKLGLRENEEVIIEYVPSVPTCYCVLVEPLSVDDWEILERHALHIETHLMDQVRIVWTGQVLPVWVGNTCIFIKIGTVEPKSSCVMLTNKTEVHVLPKLRNKSSIQQPVQEPFTKASLPGSGAPSSPVNERQRQLINQEIKDLASGNMISRQNHSSTSGSSFSSAVLSFFGIRSKSLPTEKYPFMKTEAQNVGHFPLSSLKSGLNLCLRVQQMLYDTNYSSSKIPSNSRLNSFSSFNPRAFPHQPSTVYVDLTDLEKQWKVNRNDIDDIFFAKLRRLRSPKEQEQEKSAATVGKGRASPQKSKTKSKETDGNGLDSPSEEDAKSLISDKKSEEVVTCIVRVIVIDNRRQLCNEDYKGAVESIFEKQTLCRNSVFIPDLLRRYLKADITSRVWIQTVKPCIVKAVSFNLHVLGNVHKSITTEMIQKAFCHWLTMVADDRHPLVVFQGLFVTFPVFPENFIEGQLIFTHNSDQREENVAFLYESVLNSTSLVVISGSREILHTTIRPMLAYTGVSSFDPYKPTVELSSLGGVSILAEKALSHLEICFASKPLNEKLFLTTPGLINGMLLITGVKGSGKTSLAHAVLRQVADKPNYAHTVVVECKPLRGKKVDTIQKMLELLINEAAWRQPAVILLDDLDHIMGSPSGPESEMSAEALYAARIAEVIKDLLRKEIRNLSQIAVIATSQSRSSLHPIIVSSRGSHFVQEVVEITPPNKVQREQILEAMIKGRGTLMTKKDSVNCMKIANKTEGYVARDFFNLLNRAVHAHILTMGRSSAIDGKMEITQDDFERAFHGFTPASLRNVPLHQAGELGWDDIGGLKDIKKTLVQTLQWPAKYPMLFANCPLRLQSGLLLYGAPGTGKTLLAGAVAKECGLNFISIKGPELLSKYIGASEQAVRDLFNRAQSAKPCILFFDEFDSIAPRRGHDNTGVTDRVVNQLLTQLDGVEGLDGVYVLGATSRPDLIDPALLRPGRLDKCLCCPMPDEDDRLQILQALVRKLNLARDVDLLHFAKKCTDFTGADIKALLYNSQLEAIHEFTDGNEHRKIGSPCKLPKESTLYARTKDVMGDSKLRAKVMTKEVKSSVSQSQFIYFPNLEEGAKDLTPEMEERFNIQVSQIHICDRKMSVHIPQDEKIESPLSATKMFTVQQSHLEKALAKMRPSVSEEERLKYKRIYENFLLSRGGNFGTGIHDFTMKATLA